MGVRLPDDLESEELEGTALKVYVHLLESREPKRVRDLARSLNLPVSTTHYHLKKLEEAGLIERKVEGYVIAKAIALEGFILLRRWLVPRLLIYSLFFLGVAIGELILTLSSKSLSAHSLVALISCITAFLLLMFEGLRARAKLR